MARKKRRIDRISNRQLIIWMFSISLLIAGMSIGTTVIKETIAEKKAAEARAEELAEQKRLEEEKKAKIEDALVKSGYEEELRVVYAKYPQTEEILLNMENYATEWIEYLIKNPSAVDWVVDYPEYADKPEEELNKIALEPLVLSEHGEQNGIPTLYQWDEDWGYTMYGENHFAVTGCAPTCLSMITVGLTGDVTMTPRKVADISLELNAYVEGKGTSWDLMTKGASELGLEAKALNSWSVNTLCEQLEAGKLIICSMGEGDFTTQGHFIVLVGVTEDGMILVNDPNNKENTEKEWDAKVLLEQMKGMWAFTAEGDS